MQGLAWGLVSGFTFALLAVLNRRLVREPARGRRRVLAEPHGGAVPPAVRVGESVRRSAPSARATSCCILVLGLVCTALAHTLFIAGLRDVSAHTASVIAALEPVYGIALAVLLLGEIPSVRTLAGGALIVGAAFVATRYPTR